MSRAPGPLARAVAAEIIARLAGRPPDAASLAATRAMIAPDSKRRPLVKVVILVALTVLLVAVAAVVGYVYLSIHFALKG